MEVSGKLHNLALVSTVQVWVGPSDSLNAAEKKKLLVRSTNQTLAVRQPTIKL
jgi:hypothetical protein